MSILGGRNRSRSRTWVAAAASVALAASLAACSAATESDEPVPPTPAADVTTTLTPGSMSSEDERFVSPDGDDHGPGSEDKPWRTLTHAFGAIYKGQVLYVHGGTYREELEHLSMHKGTADEPIIVTNFPGERPVVEGYVSLRRMRYWTIDGLNVTWDNSLTNPPRFMVKLTGGIGWSWRDSEIWGSLGAANLFVTGFKVGEPADWSLVGNCIHGLRPPGSRASNLMLGDMDRAGPGLVSRNLIYEPENQQNIAIGSGTGGPTNVAIRYNTIYGGSLAIAVTGTPKGVDISRNLMGGAAGDRLVRFRKQQVKGTSLRQNLAVGGQRFFRNPVETRLDDVGNVVTSEDPLFSNTDNCGGFRPAASIAAPYGRYAL